MPKEGENVPDRSQPQSQDQIDSFVDDMTNARPELETPSPATGEREPAVQTEGDAPARSTHSPAEPRAEGETDRLAAALQTIEDLKKRHEDLERRLTHDPYDTRRQPDRAEPQVEMIEVLPGLRLPKDVQQRPIKITEDDLLKLGWNDNPGMAMNNLANLLYGFILETVPEIVQRRLSADTAATRTQESRREGFFTEFSDLKGFEDLVHMTETRANSEGVLPRDFTQTDYNQTIARRTRERIAAMRGIPVEQYLSSIQGSRGDRGGATPRSVTSSGAPARGARRAASDVQRELDEL